MRAARWRSERSEVISTVPHIVYLVTGLPATGKSTFASALAEYTNAVFLSKDHYKEIAYEVMPPSTREQSKRLGIICEELLLKQIENIIAHVGTVVAESTFRPQFIRTFYSLMRSRGVIVRIVLLTTEMDVLHQRFLERASTRHAGHFDTVDMLTGCEDYEPASWDEFGSVTVVDTTRISRDLIIEFVREIVT